MGSEVQRTRIRTPYVMTNVKYSKNNQIFEDFLISKCLYSFRIVKKEKREIAATCQRFASRWIF